MCSPRKMGNTATPSGRRAPRVGYARKRSWATSRQRPTYAAVPDFVAKPAAQALSPKITGCLGACRRASAGSTQFSAGRGTGGSDGPLSMQTRRVTTATPEASRERSNEHALAEAESPRSVPLGTQAGASLRPFACENHGGAGALRVALSQAPALGAGMRLKTRGADSGSADRQIASI